MTADAYRELVARVDADPEGGLTVTTNVATNVPAEYPLTLTRGADWSLAVTWCSQPNQPEDLSAATASLVIRYDPRSTALLTLTQASGLTLAATKPNITATLTAATIAGFTWGPRATYLLTVTSGGVTRALLTGAVVVH